MRGWLTILLVLLLITPLTTLRAEEPAGPVEVSAAATEVSADALIIELTLSRPAGVRSFSLTSPDRLVFDIEDAVLALGAEAQASWAAPLAGVSTLSISQFSTEPPVVRIVAEVTDLHLQTDRLASSGGLKLAFFRGENPFAETGPGQPPEQLAPTIEGFWHEAIEDGKDQFIIDFSFGVVLPQIRIESPTVLLLRFPGTGILLPPSSPMSYGTGVDGHVVQRMRAELVRTGLEASTEIRLTVPDTSSIGYTLETYSDDSLEFVIFSETPQEPAPPPVQEPPVPEPRPVEIAGGQIMVLASGEGVPVQPDTPIKISRVQFQTIDATTDRFFVFYEGGELEARVQRFNYPTRVAFYFPDAAVVLPESAEGRFQSVVSGALTDELKVFNRVIEDVGPECQFVFYFPGVEVENVAFTIDYVDPGLMHIDFYRASTPLEIESPVEVNLSIDGAPGAPAEVEEAVPEAPVEPVIVEVTEEPAIEGPVVIEVAEQPEETVAEPAPVEPTLPMIAVTVDQISEDGVTFRITTSEPMPDPAWVEYHYPERLGLRFPLCDAMVLDADPGVYTAYSHAALVPIVRAIIKDRPDDQNTTLTFTLAGKIEEYAASFEREGNEISVAFRYSPLPAVETPAPMEPEIAPEPAPTPPMTAPPVEVPEPQIAVEPEPVVEAPEEPAEVEVTAEEVAEPVAPAPVEEAEAPGTPAAPGAPPFEPPPSLPTISLELGEVSGNTVRFRIATSEQLPMPEWVQYRYPDRLGLRFPLSNVVLLGDENAVIAQTRVDLVPIVRTIVKDRPDEQYTTLTFTLAGPLEDFDGQLDWNGNLMDVAFRYMPAAPPVPQAPAIEQPSAPVEPQPPVVVEVEVEAIPVAEPVVEETEEPVMVAMAPEEEVEEEEPAPGPVEIEAEAEPELVEEAVEAVVVTEPSGMAGAEFHGALITGVSFEKMEAADILRLTVDGEIENWEVTPINFPTKLLVRLPNSRPVMPNGDLQRYDVRVEGDVVDQYTLNATVSMDVSYTILTVYAHALESTQMLDYDIKERDGGLDVAVFRQGASSPLGPAPGIVGEERVSAVEAEAGPEVTALEPRAVRAPEEVPEAGGEVVGIETEAQPTLSMRLEDANIRDVLQLVAEQAGLNISIGPSVRGTVTISLTEIPLFDLLDLLGAQMGFTYIVQHGVYIFGESGELQRQFGAWPRWYLSISYADPDQLRGILVALQVLGPNQIQIYRGTLGGVAGVTIASPVMILTGERRDLERAYQVISAVDQAPLMIQVDFQILNTSLTDNQNFGFQFNFGTGSGTTNLFFNEQVSAEPDMGPFPQGFDRLRLGTTNVYSINYVINYLVEEGYAELMNRSSLTVANNQAGQLFVGESIPYRSTFQVSELGRVTQRVATQSVGLMLNFRPHANPDNSVTMHLTPSNTNLLELTDVGPRTVDQRFSTTVRVADNEPFIIGGFIRDEQRVNYDRFPFLSELPLLGHLFRNREVKNTRSELIFVFTPHIIRPTRHLPEIWTDADFAVPEYVLEQAQ